MAAMRSSRSTAVPRYRLGGAQSLTGKKTQRSTSSKFRQLGRGCAPWTVGVVRQLGIGSHASVLGPQTDRKFDEPGSGGVCQSLRLHWEWKEPYFRDQAHPSSAGAVQFSLGVSPG